MPPQTTAGHTGRPARQCLLSPAKAVNISGFPALPEELYMEIANQIPTIPIPTPKNHELVGEGYDRRETLLALSQTCRSLRQSFTRCLWQRIEVCAGLKIGKTVLHPWSKRRYFGQLHRAHRHYAEEIERQLEAVMVSGKSNLALSVNVINVVFPEHSFKPLVTLFARCLSLFQNAHTVQIYFEHTRPNLAEFLVKTFREVNYPQIKHVSVSRLAFPFLLSCPQVLRIDNADTHPSLSQYTWAGSLAFTAHACPLVQVVGILPCFNSTFELVALNFPYLRDVTWDYLHLIRGFELFEPLLQLRHLRTIRIELCTGFPEIRYSATPLSTPTPRKISPQDEQLWLGWAQKVLLEGKCSEHEEQRIYLTHTDGRTEKYDVLRLHTLS